MQYEDNSSPVDVVGDQTSVREDMMSRNIHAILSERENKKADEFIDKHCDSCGLVSIIYLFLNPTAQDRKEVSPRKGRSELDWNSQEHLSSPT